jgi:hypothetical protein
MRGYVARRVDVLGGSLQTFVGENLFVVELHARFFEV